MILKERVKGSYNPEANGNNFLFELLGVKIIDVVEGGSDMMAEMEKKASELKDIGKNPYIIPGGAFNTIGALGYAACAEETLAQLNDMHLNVDHIVVPSGSAGTHAGMLTGINGIDAGIPIIGINVSRKKMTRKKSCLD